MERQRDALLAANLLLAIRVDQERERGAIGATGGLHDPRDDVSFVAGSKYSRFSPLASGGATRSQSPRLWMPSSSFQPNGKRYSMSIAFFA